jgi:hypothetical protein
MTSGVGKWLMYEKEQADFEPNVLMGRAGLSYDMYVVCRRKKKTKKHSCVVSKV